jgi:hypothetical protein
MHIFQSHSVGLSLFSFFALAVFLFPQLPTLFPMPSNPPSALGGFALSFIIQKQATHGTQSMGFEAIH